MPRPMLTPRMPRRLRTALAAAGLALLATACGPHVPLKAGARAYDTDILMGSKKKVLPSPAPVASASLSPAFPDFIVPPPPPPGLLGSPITPLFPRPKFEPACPEAGAFAFPRDPATSKITVPPRPGDYAFRQKGSYTIDNASVLIPSTETRTVSNVVSHNPLQFDVSVKTLYSVTTTTYVLYLPAASTLGGAGGTGGGVNSNNVDGLYITHVVTTYTDPKAAPDEFLPAAPGLRLIAIPAQIGTTWASTATDPLHGTSMNITGTIAQHDRVDACGTVLDAFQVQVTGAISGSTAHPKALRLTAVYDVATEYGGMIIADHVTLTGVDGPHQVNQDISETINSIEPQS